MVQLDKAIMNNVLFKGASMKFRPEFLVFLKWLLLVCAALAAVYGLWNLGWSPVMGAIYYFFHYLFVIGIVGTLTIGLIAVCIGLGIVGPIFGLDILFSQFIFQTKREVPARTYSWIFKRIVVTVFIVQSVANGYMSAKMFPLARQFEAATSCGTYSVSVTAAGYRAVADRNKILQDARFVHVGEWFGRKQDSYHECYIRSWSIYLFRGY